MLARMPFFLIPLIIHVPAYFASRWAAKLVEDEEETQAQNKVVVGLLGLLITYSSAFFFLWALLWYSPVGALVAFATVWLLAVYHVKLIDGMLASGLNLPYTFTYTLKKTIIDTRNNL